MTEDSLTDIMSGRDAAPVEQAPAAPAEQPSSEGTSRDQQGRFARQDRPHNPKNSGGIDPDRPDRQPGTVPVQALDATRGKLKERDEQLAAMQKRMEEMERRFAAPPPFQQAPQPAAPPKPTPQIWEAPDEWGSHLVQQAVNPVREEFANYKLQMSRQLATQTHGKETVDAAVEGVLSLRQSNPAEFQRLEALAERSVDPVGELVRWHKQQRTVQEVGEDPEAYFQRRLAEWQASQPQGGAPPEQQQPAAKLPLPTSFSAARSAAPRGGPEYSGPVPLSAMTRRG